MRSCAGRDDNNLNHVKYELTEELKHLIKSKEYKYKPVLFFKIIVMQLMN